MDTVTISQMGMTVQQLYDELAKQIKEGRADYDVWRPASKYPANACDIIINEGEKHVLIK